MSREKEIMRMLQDPLTSHLLRRHGAEIWRRNVGAGWLVPHHALVRMGGAAHAVRQHGRWLEFGERGMADFSGWCQGGRVLEVECKSSTGRQTPEQVEWEQRVRGGGGVYVLARTLDDVLDAIGGKK